MQPAVFICVSGILTLPGDAEGWTDRAVTWLHQRFPTDPVKAEKVEYFTGALTRRFRQQKRAEETAALVVSYLRRGFRVVLMAHSNGADIVARSLAVIAAEYVGLGIARRITAHLFAPSADGADFLRAMQQGALQRLHLYGSRADKALQLAKVSRSLVGWLGIGYGSLGLEAREFAAAHPGRVFDHSNDDFGHSDWWEPGEVFETTMEALVDHEFSA